MACPRSRLFVLLTVALTVFPVAARAAQPSATELADRVLAVDDEDPILESELAQVYRKLGYVVEETPKTGDGGVDLLVAKRGKTLLVQCKGHKNPVGPAIARELYGAYTARRPLVAGAVLASPSGFTRGAKAFASGKPIELLSASDLVAMARRVGRN